MTSKGILITLFIFCIVVIAIGTIIPKIFEEVDIGTQNGAQEKWEVDIGTSIIAGGVLGLILVVYVIIIILKKG